MRTTFVRHASVLALAALSVCGAYAQATGGPAAFERTRPSTESAVDAAKAAQRSQIGPYARYLIENGMSEDAALRTARTTDRASESASSRFAAKNR